MPAKKPAKKTTAKKTASKRTTPKKAAAPRAVAPTKASAWKGKQSKRPHPLTVPSGNTCLVKRVGMQSFLTRGMIPNSLSPMISEALSEAQKGKAFTEKQQAQMMEEIQNDPERIQAMFDLVDQVVLDVVVEPRVLPAVWTIEDVQAGLCGGHDVGEEIPADDRDEDQLYVDEVDPEDKMAIFDFVVGGSGELAPFRQEAE